MNATLPLPESDEEMQQVVIDFLHKVKFSDKFFACRGEEWQEIVRVLACWTSNVLGDSPRDRELLALLREIVRTLYVLALRRGKRLEQQKQLEFVCIEEEVEYRRN